MYGIRYMGDHDTVVLMISGKRLTGKESENFFGFQIRWIFCLSINICL